MSKIDSDFALLDVKRGRKKFAQRLKKEGPVRVLIEADVEYPFGSDDGTSIEFVCNVRSVKEVAA